LSANPGAMDYLRENQDKIDWDMLSSNPAIFTYDYTKLRNSNEDLKEEVVAAALNPTRVFKLMREYDEEAVYDAYFR
jgi:hypothetical protein